MHVTVLFLQKDSSQQLELQYDEFGFRVDTEGIFNLSISSLLLSLTHTHRQFFSILKLFFLSSFGELQ